MQAVHLPRHHLSGSPPATTYIQRRYYSALTRKHAGVTPSVFPGPPLNQSQRKLLSSVLSLAPSLVDRFILPFPLAPTLAPSRFLLLQARSRTTSTRLHTFLRIHQDSPSSSKDHSPAFPDSDKTRTIFHHLHTFQYICGCRIVRFVNSSVFLAHESSTPLLHLDTPTTLISRRWWGQRPST